MRVLTVSHPSLRSEQWKAPALGAEMMELAELDTNGFLPTPCGHGFASCMQEESRVALAIDVVSLMSLWIIALGLFREQHGP